MWLNTYSDYLPRRTGKNWVRQEGGRGCYHMTLYCGYSGSDSTLLLEVGLRRSSNLNFHWWWVSHRGGPWVKVWVSESSIWCWGTGRAPYGPLSGCQNVTVLSKSGELHSGPRHEETDDLIIFCVAIISTKHSCFYVTNWTILNWTPRVPQEHDELNLVRFKYRRIQHKVIECRFKWRFYLGFGGVLGTLFWVKEKIINSCFGECTVVLQKTQQFERHYTRLGTSINHSLN